LGIWNHAIFLPSAASLIVCYTIFLWPGIRQYFINGVLYSLGFLVGLSPRFVSALFFENNLFPKRPPIPRATLKSALLNFLYTLSGDSLYARFSGKSAIPFVWETTGIILTTLATFYFFKRNKYEKKIFWGIYTFFVCNFIGVWLITPFGSIGSRLWLIPAWIFPISLVIWMPNLREWKWRVTSGILLVTHVILLLVNHYIPNNNTHGVISPSVYVGGKYDNTWDYYDHRQITNKLAQADSNLIFISTINVFTFYYLMPPEQRHKIKLLWQAIQYSTNPEKQKLYDSITYKGPIPHSALFVFYENDKDYLETFYNLSLFKETILDEKAGIPGFKVFRFK
jgi:hypothetical protein